MVPICLPEVKGPTRAHLHLLRLAVSYQFSPGDPGLFLGDVKAFAILNFGMRVLAVLIGLASAGALAARPQASDDASVVGSGRLELETWVQADASALQHWL